MVQINHGIKTRLLQSGEHFGYFVLKSVEAMNIRIMLQNGGILRFGEVVNFGIWHLAIQTTQHRRSKHNVANRTETKNEDFQNRNKRNDDFYLCFFYIYQFYFFVFSYSFNNNLRIKIRLYNIKKIKRYMYFNYFLSFIH